MLAEWHIEFAALIEAAEAVEASPIQIVEELRGFRALPFACCNQLIEMITMCIESLFFVFHLDGSFETSL